MSDAFNQFSDGWTAHLKPPRELTPAEKAEAHLTGSALCTVCGSRIQIHSSMAGGSVRYMLSHEAWNPTSRTFGDCTGSFFAVLP